MRLKVLFLTVLLIPILYGCGEEPVSNVKTGVLTGVVVDFIDAKPLANAFISTEPATKVVKTDELGKFTIDDLEAVQYKLIVEKEGYSSNTSVVTIVEGKTINTIIPLKSTTSSYATVSGKITNSLTNEPISGVLISIEPKPENFDNIKSDENGNFSFKIPAGSYRAYFSKTDYVSKSTAFDVVKSENFTLNTTMTAVGEKNKDINAYLSFDGQIQNGKVLNDINGSYEATVFNNCTITSGIKGNCLKTNEGAGNSGGWVKLDFNFNLNEFTISLWVKEISSQYTGGQSYFQAGKNDDGVCMFGRCGKWKNMSQVGDGMNYHFSVGGISTSTNVNEMPLVIDDSKYNPYAWNMFTMTYKDGVLTAYINGQYVGSKNQNLHIGTSSLMGIGSQWWGAEQATRLTALYDEFVVYKKALTETEILALFLS